MEYYINQTNFMAAFPMPNAVVDSYLKLARGEHIKVLLCIMRNMSADIPVSVLAENCGISEYDVNEALLYWADAGILLPKEQALNPVAEPQKKKTAETVIKAEKPTRQDVARRGNEDPKIKYLLNETQAKLGRNLKSNENSTLVWLYDDQGLDVSLILMVIEYAVASKKANISFIEKTAIDWVNKGINSIELAEEELNRMALSEQAWSVVCKCFGLEKRKPSQKETDLSYKWIKEWKMSAEMLTVAYEECVNAKSKFSMPYVAKIIENWHNKGYTKPEDIEKKPTPSEETIPPTYDLDVYEQLMKSKEQ